MQVRLAILAILVGVTGCDNSPKEGTAEQSLEEESITSQEDTATYHIVIGHTRRNDPADNRISPYTPTNHSASTIILTGDLTFFSSRDEVVLDHLDSAFNLGHEKVHWALGNHDYDSLPLVEQYTGRPSYYSSIHDGILWLILDSEQDGGSLLGEQLQLVRDALSTADDVQSVVIATHQLIWLQDDGPLQEEADNIINGYVGDCSYCLRQNNFYEEIYPLLVELTKQGKQVLCVAGDIGQKQGYFEHETAEGVHFLACGMKEDQGMYLSLRQPVRNGRLEWMPFPINPQDIGAP